MKLSRRFAFRLALALGWPNPDAMLARMPHRIWQEWLEYSQYEPFGEERADLRAGIIAAVIANVNRRQGRPAFRPSDFMPRFGPRRIPTPEDHLAALIAITKATGGKIIYKREGDI